MTLRQPVCLPFLYGFGLFFGVHGSLMTELLKGGGAAASIQIVRQAFFALLGAA